jgi:hypothetical protein
MERQYMVIVRTPEELVSIGSFVKREEAVEFSKQQVVGRGILIGIARVTNAGIWGEFPVPRAEHRGT